MAQKKDGKEYVEVEGINCEVKDSSKMGLVRFYQETLRPEIDKYIGNNIMTERKKAYADALKINLVVAPFVLGWLKKPDDDEYRVITGRMTIEELNKKRKGATKVSQRAQKTSSKKVGSATKTVKKPVETKKTAKSNGATMEPNNKEKPETKKAAPKAAPKNPPKKK